MAAFATVLLGKAAAQVPTSYQCVILNDTMVSSTVYEFDVYIKNTSSNTTTNPFKLSQFQGGLSVSPSFRNSGTISVTVVSGTSGLSSSQIPTPTNTGTGRAYWETTDPNYIRIAPKSLTPGTTISGTGSGTRIARFRLTNTVSFSGNPNIAWNFNSTNQAYPTKIFAYNSSTSLQVDITNSASHVNSLVNVTKFNYTTVLKNDALVNDSTYEFDIYLKNTNPNVANFPLIMSQFQGGFSIANSTRDGGTVTVSVVGSGLGSSQIPTPLNTGTGRAYWELTTPNYIRITPKSANANGMVISSTGSGTLVARIRISNSKKFLGTINLDWNYSNANQAYPSKIFAWNSSTSQQTEITTQVNHYDSLSNPTVVLPVTNLALTAFLQGMYVGSSSMTAAPFNVNGTTPSTIADTITVQLYNSASQTLAYSATSTLSTNGVSNITYAGEVSGGSYYIVIKHRNSITTWSANPVQFSASTSYSFANSDAKAAGNNLANLGSGIYGIFSGDINQDGSVDFNDYPGLDLSSSNGDLGYLPFDLNGDASVDFNDYPIIDVNSSNGVISVTP
ncbi:MAG: hypothetical protein EBZ58_13310 [Bacteroidetes bacterium]|nr:hypothetical protein [Bacteroidota bacterium]